MSRRQKAWATLLLSGFALSGCSTVHEPNASGVHSWNSAYCEKEDGSRYACSHKDLANNQIRAADYVRYRQEILGIFDKNASSTPVHPFEWEMIYFVLTNRYMSQWQGLRIALNDGYKRSPRLLKEMEEAIPPLRELANVYARRLLELPERHLMSRLLISGSTGNCVGRG